MEKKWTCEVCNIEWTGEWNQHPASECKKSKQPILECPDCWQPMIDNPHKCWNHEYLKMCSGCYKKYHIYENHSCRRNSPGGNGPYGHDPW